jgi:GAF domain-containing protein
VNLELSTSAGRWPRFAERALEEGFHSVHALPMHLKGNTIGALNMFRTDRGSLADEDVLVAQALADVATIAIIQHQTAVDAQMLNSQLNEALNSRIIIEQAKGKISESAGIDVDHAFRRLRNHARSNNLRLTDLAREVADGTTPTSTVGPLPTVSHMRSTNSNPWTKSSGSE